MAEVFSFHPRSGEIFAELWKIYANPQSYRLLHPTTVLRTVGRHVVLTNFDHRAIALVKHLPLPVPTKRVWVAEDLPQPKPHPQAFQKVKVRGWLPVLVDDHPVHREVARKLGFVCFASVKEVEAWWQEETNAASQPSG